MDIDFPTFDNDHLPGDCAMRPIAPRLTRQSRHTQAHSTAVSRFNRLPGRSPVPSLVALGAGYQKDGVLHGASLEHQAPGCHRDIDGDP